MMRQLSQTALIGMVLLVLVSIAAISSPGATLPAAAQQSASSCSTGYVLWADSLGSSSILDWSSSGAQVQGRVHSNNDIQLSGSNNVITGTIEYVTSFSDDGDANQYASPVQVSPGIIPASYNVADYQPGGVAAAAAEEEGRYHYIDGDLEVSDGNVQLDGLYYVTGDVVLSGSNLHGTVTIVARKQIEIVGSQQNFTAYSDGLLFFSEQTANNEAGIRIGSSDSAYAGMFYAPGAQIELSGSANAFSGGFFARKLKLSGSSLTVAFDEQYCPGEPPPTPTPTNTPPPPPPPGPIAQYLPVLLTTEINTMGEPNNDCRQAYAIRSGATNQFLAEDLHDWYHFTVAEPADVTIRVSNFVALAGQVAAFYGDTCDTAIFLQNDGDTALEKSLALGQQPAGHFFVYVSNDGVFNTTDPYSLLVDVR